MLAPALALALVVGAPAKKPPPLLPVTISQLKNRLTVARVKVDSPGIIAFYTVVRVGSRNEVEPGHTGFAHFFEHMMFRGTKRFPEGQRGTRLSTLGFNENAFTSDDMTVYTVNGPTSGLATLVELEADRFMNLEYAEPAFRTEALAVAGEYQKSASSPGLKIEETTLGAAFTTHTYRHTTLGFWEDIQAMPERYEYSKTFFKRWYAPDNVAIVVVGDFDDQALMQLINQHYGSWRGKAATVTIPPEPPQTQAKVATLEWPTKSLPRLGLAWHTPAATLTTMDAAVQQVLAAYLVGPTSALHKKLVLDERRLERIGSFYDHHRDPSLFGIDARLLEEPHREPVRAAILQAIEQVKAGTIEPKRLADIRSNLKYGAVMELETPPQIALQLAWNYGVFGSFEALEVMSANYERVTPAMLQSFAKTYLVDTNRTTLEMTIAGAKP